MVLVGRHPSAACGFDGAAAARRRVLGKAVFQGCARQLRLALSPSFGARSPGNRVGGGIFSPRPPHHPACGSAQGGSLLWSNNAVSSRLRALRCPFHPCRVAGVRGHGTLCCQGWLLTASPIPWLARSGFIAGIEMRQAPPCTVRFGPSPCPPHYQGPSATMTSADSCLITPWIAPSRADGCRRIRWFLHPFPGGPQSDFPSALDRCGRVRWLVHRFRDGPQSGSRSRRPARETGLPG